MNSPSYEKRLRIPITGDARTLHTKSGTQIATGYTSVVIGARGPYVEFAEDQLDHTNFREVRTPHYYTSSTGLRPTWRRFTTKYTP